MKKNPVNAVMFRTNSEGRQLTAKKISHAMGIFSMKHKLGSLSLYGTPYFIIIFVIAGATVASCQYVSLGTTIQCIRAPAS